jgi:hypothetical protein
MYMGINMDKTMVIITIILAILAVILAAVVLTGQKVSISGVYTADNALLTARSFVTSEPTYRFDGIPDTLVVGPAVQLQNQYTYAVNVEFTSRHGGYGDRTGMMTTEALTYHKGIIVVSKNKIAAAVLDDQWDMKNVCPVNTGIPSTSQ